MSTPTTGTAVPEPHRPLPGWWRPAAWIVVVAASTLPPGPSWVVACLTFLAGACALSAERVAAISARIGLVAATAACGLAATLLVPANGLGPVPIFMAAVSAGRLIPWRRTVVVVVALVGLLFAGAVAHVSGSPWGLFAGIGVPMIAARAWDREALRREHERVLALLGELEQRRAGELRAAAADERARIARDLHDVLAHTLSGLSLHLQAVRAVVARDPEPDPTVVTALDRAADLARDGLDEARRAVTALRETPAPGVDDLSALVAGHPEARLEVHGVFGDLAPELRETAFATVRESLTNAGRHAPGATVSVALDVVDGLLVRVDDDGAAEPPAASRDRGGGNGLRGLAERAAAAGGTLAASARSGGWSVVLRVPPSTTTRETP